MSRDTCPDIPIWLKIEVSSHSNIGSLLDSIISNLASCKISIFELFFVAKQVGLSLTLSKTSKTDCLMLRPLSFRFSLEVSQ